LSYLDEYLKRNKEFAVQQRAAGELMPSLKAAMPNLRGIVITCADPRVDPEKILGINLGEVVVLRNIGGRVTPNLLEELGLLAQIGVLTNTVPGGGGEFHLIVMHHTNCGITILAGEKEKLAHYFQIAVGELEKKSVSDPHAAVKTDVATLKAIPMLPAQWLISGVVYDVATGLVEVVVPAAPIRSA
jgi:carbonic anhydrase